MKSFKEYLVEGGGQVISTQREVKANLDDPNTLDEMNRFLMQVAAKGFADPYAGLQAVSKVLSTYGIVLPIVRHLPEPKGEEVFEVQQFGVHPGYTHRFDSEHNGIHTNSGIVPYQNVKSAAEQMGESLYVYFCWEMNSDGVYDCFCIIVDDEGLSTLMAVEETEYDEEELEEQQLDEISRKTLRSYIDKTTNKTYDTPKKFRNRVPGRELASNKISPKQSKLWYRQVKVKATGK